MKILFTAGAVIALIIILFFIFNFITAEGFNSKPERSAAIVEWFHDQKHPRFANFKQHIPNANIVEYTDALSLMQRRELNKDTLLKTLVA